MERKYIIFHTAKAAIFLFYALLLPLFVLFYAALSQEIPRNNLIGGIILYLSMVVIFAAGMDRPKRGLTQWICAPAI
jgi:hypothetical protein